MQRRPTVAYRVARLLLAPLLHGLFCFRVRGKTNIPKGTPYVLIANHLNWLDSFAILLAFPLEPRIHFLGDPYGLRKRRFQWAFIRAIGGYIPVNNREGNGPRLYRHVDTCLQRGGVVALYPEGQYGDREGEILPVFKKGFAHFAIDNGVPVLPVALSGTKEPWFRKRIVVTIGEAFDDNGCSVEELVATGHDRLAALIPPYREPRGPKPLRSLLTRLF